MKTISLIISVLLFANMCMAHYIYEDSNQPDSVYRIHKVKSRTLKYTEDNMSVKYDYDTLGKLVAEYHLLKDSLLISKTTMLYDDAGLLIKEETGIFFKQESLKKGIHIKSDETIPVKKTITLISKDANGNIQKKTMYDQNNEPVKEITFISNPSVRIEKYFHPQNSGCDSILVEYEKENFIKRITQYLVDQNKIKKVSEQSFINYFNKDGNIEKRNLLKVTRKSVTKTKEEYYQYNQSGLLIEKMVKSYYPKKTIEKKLIISYTYW